MRVANQVFQNTLLFLLTALVLAGSTLVPPEASEGARQYTQRLEFDYVSWTADALLLKLGQASLSLPRYLSESQQETLIKNYLKLVQQIDDVNHNIELVYADPKIADKTTTLKPWQDKLAGLRAQRAVLGPAAEEVFQRMVSSVLDEFSLSVGGQPLPPVLYHVTPLPYALIISPRDVIRQETNISLDPNLTLEQMVSLEKQVEEGMNVSALVTPIGGIGIYPTMVMSTTDLPWLGEVVAHEWTHNYLTLRPLGLNYYASGQLRTMNETVANIVGKEVSLELLRRYFPENLPQPTPTRSPSPTPGPKPAPTATLRAEPQGFNFNKEMRTTRVMVDALLKDGKVREAEAYMEARRKVFLDNGYLIRRLNQAYFAFNGAYADIEGGGAAGEDPVGPAVVKMRKQSTSLADFLNKMAQMSSFADLQKGLQ
jgi:hypothetical protein